MSRRSSRCWAPALALFCSTRSCLIPLFAFPCAKTFFDAHTHSPVRRKAPTRIWRITPLWVEPVWMRTGQIDPNGGSIRDPDRPSRSIEHFGPRAEFAECFMLVSQRRRFAMGETRKIAAILVADVVGYSRLAGADEEGTLARLRALRSDLIDPTVAAHHGRVVKRTGDGFICEFRSVVDATRCAIELQSGMVQRNAGMPGEPEIVFRIGVHLGDIVEEADGDLMGDGVNIAARIEGIANPGGICLSEQAYWQVKGRLDLAARDLGLKKLKNIAEPIR